MIASSVLHYEPNVQERLLRHGYVEGLGRKLGEGWNPRSRVQQGPCNPVIGARHHERRRHALVVAIVGLESVRPVGVGQAGLKLEPFASIAGTADCGGDRAGIRIRADGVIAGCGGAPLIGGGRGAEHSRERVEGRP